MKYAEWKRISDVTFALLLLVLTSPILLVISLLIKLEDPSGPVIFRQERTGKDNKAFTIFKFRSMKVENYFEGKELTDAERMLRIGNIIRVTSLDELPQLINIIKGEMSFIGPRPLPHIFLPYFTEQENLRHNIRPGISGWAQVNGRNNVTWEEKFDLDLYYLDHLSFSMDIKILFLTIVKIIKASDIVETKEEINQNFVEYRA